MAVARKTVLDRYSEYRDIARGLFALFGKAKQARTQCDGLGLTAPYPDTGAGPALAAVEFPLTGENGERSDLTHIDSAGDLPQLVKSLEALEAALTTPVTVDGEAVLPIAVFAKFAG